MNRDKAILIALILTASSLLFFYPLEGDGIGTRAGNILYVSPSGSTYDEPQRALENATEGDIIYVAAGNYTEGMRITTDGISIIGNSTAGDVRISNPSMFVSAIQANDVMISGLNLTCDIDLLGILALANSNNVTLKDVVIYSETDTPGLIITSTDKIDIQDLEVSTSYGLPVQIKNSNDIEIRGFELSTKTYWAGLATDESIVTDLVLENGMITLQNSSTNTTALAFAGGVNATIQNVTSLGGDYFLINDEGTIDMINTPVEKDRLFGGDKDGRINVWFERQVYLHYLDRFGDEVPAAIAEIRLTVDQEITYATGYYGGWDLRSSSNGTFNEPFKLLTIFVEGDDPPAYGSNIIKARYGNDREQDIELLNIDANSTNDLVIIFDDVSRTNGTLIGYVGYNGGPLGTQKAPNATVEILHPELDSIFTAVTNASGGFTAEELPFTRNFTIKVIPPEAVDIEGNISGYAMRTWDYTFKDNATISLWIEYFQYIPPTNGTLSGRIAYDGGPMDGMNTANATVVVYDGSMTELANTTTNETGEYEFIDLVFGYDYSLSVIPPDAVQQDGEEDGYLETLMVFHHDQERELDIMVMYYMPEASGPIHGYVRYQEGPKGGQFVPNASVVLYNLTGAEVGSMLSDENGYFIFQDMPFDVGYELRITPPEEDAGINNEETGYLFWDGSAFPHNGTTMINASLKYYEYREPVKHPKVTIVDENGDPVENVTIVATIDDRTYTAVTDEFGNAVFTDIEDEGFPNGTELEASKPGWEKRTWSSDQPVPPMKLEQESDSTMIFLLLALLVIIITGAFLVVFFMTRSKEEIIEE